MTLHCGRTSNASLFHCKSGESFREDNYPNDIMKQQYIFTLQSSKTINLQNCEVLKNACFKLLAIISAAIIIILILNINSLLSI